MTLEPTQIQIEMYNKAKKILADYHIVYLAAEERVGKSLPALMLSKEYNNVLLITKKKVLNSWKELIKNFGNGNITLINYHSLHKISKQIFDLVILDEAHNYISSYPKPSQTWKKVRKFTLGADIVYISATPYAQGHQLLYWQLALSDWSPFREYKNFYSWFQVYGKPYEIYIHGRKIKRYDKTKTKEIEAQIKHLFVKKTRKEAGFLFEPEDVLHYINLDQQTKLMYNTLLKKKIIKIRGKQLVANTSMKLRTALHMIEGGVAKIDNSYYLLNNTEKIDYILKTWGDNDNLVIYYNYIAEGAKLKKYFKKALILQATSFAEGIDLYQYDNLVIYSQDFSTARFTQRRARQTHIKRNKPIKVHFLLVKNAISEQVYKTVSINKQNFIDKFFNKLEV